jgi:O-antigen/teichoic acid export membrane protein
MGLFALLFTIAILLETFVSLGLSDSLVRDVAAHPGEASSLYASALKLVIKISVLPAAALAGTAWLFADAGAARTSLLVIAAGAPISGAFVVSQAILQGTERVTLLTWVAFAARAVSLVALTIALYLGSGIEAAFGSRLLFEGLAVAVFYFVLRATLPAGNSTHTATSLLKRSAPFAVSLGVRNLVMRLPSLVLPGAIGLGPAGVFDSANRIRSTLGMTMSASIVGLMPSFTRSLGQATQASGGLVAYTVKYMCIGMAAVATILALLSDWIIRFFYGNEFAQAAVPLQILAFAQVPVAVDAVLQQALLATGSAYRAISHTSAGLAAQFILLLLLVQPLGLPGAALAVLLASVVPLALDLAFVVRHVAPFALLRFVFAPLSATALVATALQLVGNHSFTIRLLTAAGAWLTVVIAFRLLPLEEIRFMRSLALPGRAKQSRPS